MAVVGHVEWVTFARVPRMPLPGRIVHAEEVFEAPAGGGPVAAVQLAKLAGRCALYTALGADDLGARAARELTGMGLEVHAASRDEPQRRAFTHVDAATAERTITVMGSRLGPHGADGLLWRNLEDAAVYFCAGDDEALRLARRARVLVVTAREAERLRRVGVYADAVVGSAKDPDEDPGELDPAPGLLVRTRGAGGAEVIGADGQRRELPAPVPPGPVVCTYGAGDSFAGGLTYALGAGYAPEDAVALAARCGAACITGRGPYAAQLDAAGLREAGA